MRRVPELEAELRDVNERLASRLQQIAELSHNHDYGHVTGAYGAVSEHDILEITENGARNLTDFLMMSQKTHC